MWKRSNVGKSKLIAANGNTNLNNMNKDNNNDELDNTDKKLHISDVMVSSYRLRLGIKKYGYNSEFRKEYESMTAQLRYDELNGFFDKWDVPKN